MDSNPSSSDELTAYPDLPSSQRDSPEAQAARVLDERAHEAQGRLALGCFIFWLDRGGYLLTTLPPMGDVLGSETEMTIYTAEHLVTVRGENLHELAWAMKQQRVDDLRVTSVDEESEDGAGWVITSITARERSVQV